MNSPKDSRIGHDDRSKLNSPDTEVESVSEKNVFVSKIEKKTTSPQFSIDSLILRKNKDVNSGKCFSI